MSKTMNGRPKRLLSGFLAVCLVFSLAFVGLGGLEAEAALNNTVQTALTASGVPTTTSGIDLSNNPNIFGDVDISDITAIYTNATYINLSGTNITAVSNIPAGVTVVRNDTIANGDRAFVVTGTGVTFTESTGADLSVDDLISQVQIRHADNSLHAVPVGMLLGDAAGVEINGVQYAAGPGTTIPAASILAHAAGTHAVTLAFPISESTLSTNLSVNLILKKSGYTLTTISGGAANAIVYDGGTVDLFFRSYDENGVQKTLGALADYKIQMSSSASPVLTIKSSERSADGLQIKVTVEAQQGVLVSSAYLEVEDLVGNLLASKEVVKYSNADVSNLSFVEYAFTGGAYAEGAAVASADRIYIKGGTSISSATASNLNTFTNSTRYLLTGTFSGGGGSGYIPARYLSQVAASIGTDLGGNLYDLDCDIIAVDNPSGAGEQVLALVVKARSVNVASYTNGATGTEPVLVKISNAGGTTVQAYLNVQVAGSAALGYSVYQIPSIYAGYNKSEIEDAVNSGTDPEVRLISRYEMVGGAWTEIEGNGAEIVEESTAYFVTLACYEPDGQLFIVTDSEVNGWYFDETSMQVIYTDVAPINIGTTSMTAQAEKSTTLLPTTGFSAGSHILVVNAPSPYTGPESAGIVFAPNQTLNNVSFNVKLIQKEVRDYVIVPAGYVLAPGMNYYTALQDEIATYDPLLPGPFPLYELNVLGEDTIAIGGTNNYGIAAVYSNYKSDITFAAPPATSVSNDVTLNNWTSAAQPADVADSTAPADNNYFEVAVRSAAGAADANAGETFDITYTNGTVSSKTVTITITNSDITGYHLVFEDLNGNRFSSAAELYTYCNDIEDLSALSTNFEIPVGTVAKVYAVYSFTNAEFYSNFTNWSAFASYIVPLSNWQVTTIPVNYAVASGTNCYELTGITAANGETVGTAPDITGTLVVPGTITISGTAFNVIAAPNVNGVVDIVAPLITEIEAYDTVPAVIADSAVVPSTVGDVINTDPVVGLSDTTTGLLTAFAPGSFLGDVTMNSSVATVARPNATSPYILEMIGGGTTTITYVYEYTLNDQVITETIFGTVATGNTTSGYSFDLNIDNAEILEVYLVAKNVNMGTLAYAGDGVYTAPYSIGLGVEVHPVALNSLALLDAAFLTDLDTYVNLGGETYIDEAFVNQYPQYFDYLTPADMSMAPADWTLSGVPSGSGTLQTTGGTYHYDVQFFGEIPPAAPQTYLTVEFDITGVALPAGSSFSGIAASATGTGAAPAAGTANPSLAHFYHLVDAASAYVVDIDTTEVVPAGVYFTGSPVQFDVNYYISTQPAANSGYYVSPKGYFFPTDPAVPLIKENPSDHTANALHVDELNVPDSNGYTLSINNDRLTFTPSVAGLYEFKLYTYNNGNVLAPYYSPSYYTLSFTVNPTTATQTVYYGKTDNLVGLSSITGWSSIVETGGGGLLDAAALSNGQVKMNSNTSGTTTVEVLDASGNTMLQVTVNTVSATISAALNQNTTAATPVALSNGGTTLLYWNVTYTPSDATAPYNLVEEITNWAVDFQTHGSVLNLSGYMVTAQAGTTSEMVAYKATHTDGTTQLFWAQIDASTTVSYNYYITDATAATVTSASMNVGTPETFDVFDTATSAAANIAMIDSSNTAVAQVTSTGNSFTVTPVSNGLTTITVYPTTGGSVTLAVNVGSVTPATHVVSGTVTDGTNPIAGASVLLNGVSGTFTATTDALGNFTLSVPADSYTGTVSATGYTPATVASFNVAAATNLGTIILTPAAVGHTVDGLVEDNTTTLPIANAAVVLLDSTSAPVATTTTDTVGHYSFANVVDASYTVVASASGYAPDSTAVTVSAANVTATTLSLVPSATVFDITGTVEDGAANPIVNASVTVTDGINTYYAMTDANGDFTVAGVADNATYTVTVAATGFNPETVTATVTGANEALGTITMTASASSYSITGQVTNVGGTGIASATVTIVGAGGHTATTSTDTLGNYTFTGVPGSDTYTITVVATGYKTGSGSVAVASSNVTAATIVLAASGGGGGGGGGGTTVTYKVTVNSGNGGSASANKTTASAGTSITVTVTADSGYVVDTVTATDAKGNTVNVSASSTSYKFTMPANDVTVNATFKVDDGSSTHKCPSAPYVDVDISLWYHEYIDYVIEHGAMVGTSANTFEPGSNVTRGMMVQLFYNIENKPATTGSNSFTDVSAGDWYYDAVLWASANGIVTGYDESTYGPNDSVTREQMVTMLYRYTSYKGYSTSATNDLSAFVDAGSVSGYALGSMQWAVGASMVNGRDATHLVPGDTATRAEVATLITNYCRANSVF